MSDSRAGAARGGRGAERSGRPAAVAWSDSRGGRTGGNARGGSRADGSGSARTAGRGAQQSRGKQDQRGRGRR
ncbi:hypothetical protein [Paenibacillus hexagrammi]|uniref:Uncharacterized protein n=1 Tax=Paenibacillus hexagrammi TaxID=2908839 RepID=A0ABY3SJC4_9BACL|nr:hypothetical protein [Paenibacillus sp. YPD9-1]UJF34147.1 hypothetical protein L0M14_02625 [Paenibacillus sp. YPD9-1]